MASKQFPAGSFPGWRTMTGAQRRNAKMAAIFERANALKTETRFNASSRNDGTHSHGPTCARRFASAAECDCGVAALPEV